MSAWSRHIFLGVLLLAGGALFAGDYELNVDMVTGADADIKLTVPGGQGPLAGFLPLRVRINNRGNSERSWRLEMVSSAMTGYQVGAGLNWTSTFDVPGASTREFFVFAPLTTGPSRLPREIHGRVDGPQVQGTRFDLRLAFGWGTSNAPVAVEPGLEARLSEAFDRSDEEGMKLGRRGPRGRGPSALTNVSFIDPAQWPADWRLWSSFATVVLEQASWDRLDTTRRQALLDYVALGGRLVRVNSIESRERFGAGVILTRAGSRTHPANVLLEYVLGEFNWTSDPAGSLATAAFWEQSPREWQLGGQHRWLTGYIMVFGLLIGPVNLFYFAPAGRRHRLFFTVPVISCAAAVLLFGIITIKDGFGGAGTRRALVVLQPTQNRAVVFQRQISRTGLLLGRKFALAADVIMNLEVEERPGTGANPQLWREGDSASGDWFTSRSTQQHSLRRLVPTRERVELVGAPGSAPVVQSSVGGTLRDFLYLDSGGKLWSAPEVAPGRRVTLAAAPDRQYAGNPKYLPTVSRGTFYALGGTGDLIPTLASIAWRDDLVLYTGRLSPTPEAAP